MKSQSEELNLLDESVEQILTESSTQLICIASNISSHEVKKIFTKEYYFTNMEELEKCFLELVATRFFPKGLTALFEKDDTIFVFSAHTIFYLYDHEDNNGMYTRWDLPASSGIKMIDAPYTVDCMRLDDLSCNSFAMPWQSMLLVPKDLVIH